MTSMDYETRRRLWEEVPEDPDLERDLGYSVTNWEMVETQGSGNAKLVFMPADEDLLHDAEFIVVAPDDICDLLEMR